MKKIGYLGVALALMLALPAAQAEQRLTVVLDSCYEMKASKAVDTAISYINTLLPGYAKSPTPPELVVTLQQIYATSSAWSGVTDFHIAMPQTAAIQGQLNQFYPDKKHTPARESVFTLAATKKLAQDQVFDWAKHQSNGIILISPAPQAKALNLGEGFHRVIIPDCDDRGRLDKNKFTDNIQSAFDEFMAIAAAAVTELKASATKVYTLGSVTFDIALEGTETAMVDFGDGNTEEYRAGNPIQHPFEKAGRYEVTARVSARDPGKSVKILVVDASATDLAVRPSRLTPAVDAEVSFVLHGAPSAAVQFGDDTPPAYAKGDSKGAVSIRHRYGKPGSYTLQVTPRNGAKSFAPAKLAVVVADEPHRLGLELKAARTKATLPDGRIEFHATLDNAVRAEIDYGDKTPVAKAATGRLVHDYGKAGTFEAKLTAWAADGTTDSQTCTVQIAEPAVPVPTCEFPQGNGTATAGGLFEVRCQFSNTESATASFSDAPDAALSLDIAEDGSATIRHDFRADGEQFVLVTMEGNGKTAEARYRVAVERPDETFGNLVVGVVRNGTEDLLDGNGAGYYQIKVGDELICGVKPSRNVSIRVDFGDGCEERGTTSVGHIYQQSGEYTVTLRGTGSITKTPKGPITFTVQVKGDPTPILVVLGGLVVLVGGFFGLAALLKPKYFLRVTPPGKEPLNRNFGLVGHRCDLSLDGLNVVVALKGETLELTSTAVGITANGQLLGAEAPVEIAESEVEVFFGHETWIIECLKK